MSGQVTTPSRDADVTSGPSKRTSGMFDWMRRIAKPPTPISKSCIVLSNKKEKTCTMMTEPNKDVDTKKTSDSCSPDLSVSQNEDKVVEEKLVVQDTCKEDERNDESNALTCLSADQLDCGENSGQVVAFEKQFSSDNFACIDKGKCRYKKFSTLLLLEKKTNNNTSNEWRSMAKNFYPFFRNVETMRICTMVDSGGPKISQRAHQFQFTKETCVNLSQDHPMTAHVKEKTVGEFVRSSPFIYASHSQGVRIEPLQTVSDNEGTEMVGANLSSETDARNESSVQLGATQSDDVRNQIVASGSKSMTSSPAKEDDATDETVGTSTEKARNKRPIIEIPDMNEEITTLQSEGSSTNSKEVSTLRVQSLNAKHLFPVDEQPSKSEFRPVPDPSPDKNYHNSRWIKRLRVSSSNEYYVGTMSSNITEPSAHKKYGEFLNKIMKKSNIPTASGTDQNADSLNSPKDGIYNVVNSCPWVKRWRKDADFGCNSQVLCEPHSLQVGVDEVGKRQFPSIGAMALMGKTMNGLRSCEIEKKGSVSVWHTKEY